MEDRSVSLPSYDAYPPALPAEGNMRKRKHRDNSLEKIEKIYAKLNHLITSYSSDPQEGEDYETRISAQTLILQKTQETTARMPLLASVRTKELDNLKKRKTLDKISLETSIEMDNKNLKKHTSDFRLLCTSSQQNPYTLEKIENYYTAFCEYAWGNSTPPLETGSLSFIATEAKRYLGEEKTDYFFSVDDQNFSVPKLLLAASQSNYFQQIFHGNFLLGNATKEKPFCILECDPNIFLEVCKFIIHGKKYDLPNPVKLEELIDLLFKLLEKALYFQLPALAEICERQLNWRMTGNDAKRFYCYALEHDLPSMLLKAFLFFGGISNPPFKPSRIMVITCFFKNIEGLPPYPFKFDTLDLLDCTLSSKGIEKLVSFFPHIKRIFLPLKKSICRIKPDELKQFSQLESVIIKLPKKIDLTILEDERFRTLVAPYKISFTSISKVSISTEVLKTFAKFNPIEKFEFGSSDLADFRVLFWKDRLSRFPHIKSLAIPAFIITPELTLPALCPELTKLNLKLPIPTPAKIDIFPTLLEIVGSCKNLKTIKFGDFEGNVYVRSASVYDDALFSCVIEFLIKAPKDLNLYIEESFAKSIYDWFFKSDFSEHHKIEIRKKHNNLHNRNNFYRVILS